MSKKESSNTGLGFLPTLTGYFVKKFEKVEERNVSDMIVKTGAGLFIGTVASLTLMKRTMHPAVIGASFGSGTALGNYFKEMNELQSAGDPIEPEQTPVEANTAKMLSSKWNIKAAN